MVVVMRPGTRQEDIAALAEQFGLHRGPEFRGMSLPVQDDSFQPQPKPLHLLGGEEAAEYLLPLQEKTGGFLSINHTFYKLNRSTCFGFAAAGWVYGDGEGSVLVCGARFQPQKALYIAALAAPDKAKKENALSFARNLAAMTGAEKLTVHFPNQDQQEQQLQPYLASRIRVCIHGNQLPLSLQNEAAAGGHPSQPGQNRPKRIVTIISVFRVSVNPECRGVRGPVRAKRRVLKRPCGVFPAGGFLSADLRVFAPFCTARKKRGEKRFQKLPLLIFTPEGKRDSISLGAGKSSGPFFSGRICR